MPSLFLVDIRLIATCKITNASSGGPIFFFASVPLLQILIPRHNFSSSNTVETARGACVPVLIALVVATAALLVHAFTKIVIIRGPLGSVARSTEATRLTFARLSFEFLEALDGLGDGGLRSAQ
jgi:hypothetical protein